MSNANTEVQNNDLPGYKRIIFYYDGGEKTILTIRATDEDIETIAKSIAGTSNEFVYLKIGTEKEDLILVNKAKFIFLMATTISEREAREALYNNRRTMLSEGISVGNVDPKC